MAFEDEMFALAAVTAAYESLSEAERRLEEELARVRRAKAELMNGKAAPARGGKGKKAGRKVNRTAGEKERAIHKQHGDGSFTAGDIGRHFSSPGAVRTFLHRHCSKVAGQRGHHKLSAETLKKLKQT